MPPPAIGSPRRVAPERRSERLSGLSEKLNKPLHMKAPHEVRAELDPEGAERKKQIDALRMRMKAVDLE